MIPPYLAVAGRHLTESVKSDKKVNERISSEGYICVIVDIFVCVLFGAASGFKFKCIYFLFSSRICVNLM